MGCAASTGNSKTNVSGTAILPTKMAGPGEADVYFGGVGVLGFLFCF